MTCSCHYCNKIQSWIDQGVSIDFIEEYADISDQLDYHKAILDGSWPNAVELLTAALNNAKEKAE